MAANQNREEINTVWRAIHQLEKEVGSLSKTENKRSGWIWNERSWSIPTIVVVVLASLSGTWYIAGLVVDRHLQLVMNPLQQQVSGIDGRIKEIDERLGIRSLPPVGAVAGSRSLPGRLKRIVAQQALDPGGPEGGAGKKVVGPRAKREAVRVVTQAISGRSASATDRSDAGERNVDHGLYP